MEYKFSNYMHDKASDAIIIPNAVDRAMMYQGHASGTPLGEFLKSMWQFKAWPIAFWNRTLDLDWKDERNYKILGELFAYSLVAAYINKGLEDLSKGNVPNYNHDSKEFWTDLVSTALPIVGDVITGANKRYDGNRSDFLEPAGLSVFEDAADLAFTYDGARSKAYDAFSFVESNLPYQNFWATQAFWQKYVVDGIAELISPSDHYKKKRWEERQRAKQGTTPISDYF